MSITELTNHHDLTELEMTIATGFANFLSVGTALIEIQQRKLFLDDGYETFEQYCAKRWSISRSQAYRMIESAEVVTHLSETKDLPLPITEAQTRALARLREPEAMRTVWEEVVDEYGESASAPRVREAVDYFSAIEEDPTREAFPREEVIADYRAARKKPPMYARTADSAPAPEVVAPPETLPFALTGEIVPESADAPAFRDTRTSIWAGKQLLALDPGRWAPQMDDATANDVRSLITDLRRWCDTMEGELAQYGGNASNE